MKRHCISVLVVVLALFLAARPVLEAQTESPSAEALLQEMETTYAGMNSYSDKTIARYRNPDGAEGARAECNIWFARPNLFRIDGQSRRNEEAPPKREVIWSDGETARSWSTATAVTIRSKIQLAGSKMFGTYAYHVPTLLEASYGGPRRLHQLSSPKSDGEEVVDGVDCYRIKGEWQGDPYELWLGKADSLVHKIRANYKGYELEELHENIVVNQPIPDDIFHFAPENEAARSRPRSSPAASRGSSAAPLPKKK